MYKSGRSRERADPNTVPSSIRYFADREDKPDFSETVAGSSKTAAISSTKAPPASRPSTFDDEGWGLCCTDPVTTEPATA
jgi:hypothetical protein